MPFVWNMRKHSFTRAGNKTKQHNKGKADENSIHSPASSVQKLFSQNVVREYPQVTSQIPVQIPRFCEFVRTNCHFILFAAVCTWLWSKFHYSKFIFMHGNWKTATTHGLLYRNFINCESSFSVCTIVSLMLHLGIFTNIHENKKLGVYLGFVNW